MDLAPYRRQHGRFPIEHRDWPVDADGFAKFAAKGREPIGAAVLAWNRRREILLLRHRPETGWRDLWATPGGMAEKGETAEACAVREAREETGLAVTLTALTKVVVCHVAHEARTIPYTFFQFEGTAAGEPRPGRGIAEVAWVEGLPVAMHFRADYLEPWLRGRPRLG